MSTRLKTSSMILAFFFAVCLIVPNANAQGRITEIFSAPNSSGGFLGIRMEDVTEKNMSEYKLDSVGGVIVQSVIEGSPAENAGLEEGDVLLDFDGVAVRSTLQLSRLVRETPVGREVKLVVSREGNRKNLTARVQEQETKQADIRRDLVEPFFRNDPRYFYFDTPDQPNRALIMPRLERPRLGISLQPLSEQMASYMGVPGGKGALVSSVEKGSVSEGKLKAGDVIVRADSKDIEAPEDVINLVAGKRGGTIEFKVIREKRELSVTVQMADSGGEGFRL